MIELEVQVEGWFTLSAFKVDADGNERAGTRREVAGPFRNLITNGGLDRMGTADDWMGYCQVGSGNSTPVVTNSALVARVAGSSVNAGESRAAQPSAPYYYSVTRTFRFAVGVATGNLAEVGVGWAATGSLFSRALILDTAGDPTTITVLADEVLDVTYQFRCYPPLTDTGGTVTLAGASYAWTGRASKVATYSSDEGWSGPEAATVKGGNGSIQSSFDGTIGTITGKPSGTGQAGVTASNLAYSAGSFSREGTLTFELTQGNFAGGLGAILYRQGMGCYQIGFTPKIPKDGTKVLALTVRTTWARKAL